MKASQRKKLAKELHATSGNYSIRLVCKVCSISEGCFRYKAKLSNENELLKSELLQLSEQEVRWGFGLCFLYLRNTCGYPWNHKRVYRIYKELELNLRIKPNKRLKREKPAKLAVPSFQNQCWSMDFTHDQLTDGRPIRFFNVTDDFNRECITSEVDLSLPAERVIGALNRTIEWRGKPKAIRCDNGPEFISKALEKWSIEQGIELLFIEPGKPQQNAYVERFNRTMREEFLSLSLFDSLAEAQWLLTKWLWKYNNVRPNTAIGGKAPRSLVA